MESDEPCPVGSNAAATERRSPTAAARQIVNAVWEDLRWPIAIVLTSSLVLRLLAWTVAPGLADPLNDGWSALFFLQISPFLVLVVAAWQRLVQHRSWSAMGTSGPLEPTRLCGLVLTLLLTRWIGANAIAWKYGLRQLHPFAYDVALRHLDHSLHGVSPWRLLKPFTSPTPLRVLDWCYTQWFPIFFMVMTWWGWAPRSPRRTRFLTAVTLTWILGYQIAVLLPAAGPVYFTRVTGQSGPYGELLRAIRAVPLTATWIQEALWTNYVLPSGGLMKGIAAFPSLHVAMPVLYAVSSRTAVARVIWWIYAGVIFVGSIVLGWHYAVDGYAAVLLVMGCWWLACRIHESSSQPFDRPHRRGIVGEAGTAGRATARAGAHFGRQSAPRPGQGTNPGRQRTDSLAHGPHSG